MRSAPRWRERSASRKSPWKFLLLLVVLLFTCILWYWSFQLMWRVHIAFFPSHAGHLAQFWPAGVPLRSFVSSFLLLMPLAISSLLLAMILGNALVWCIPWARRSFARDAARLPEIGFRPVMASLLRWGWIPVLIGFSLSFLGACTLHSLR